MQEHASHTTENNNRANAHQLVGHPDVGEGLLSVDDKRPETAVQRKLQEAANNSPAVQRFTNLQQMANNSPQVRQLQAVQAMVQSPAATQKTALPGKLRSGIERISGMSMGDVSVHYQSPMPAQLQARAFAQGTDIHIAPGEERHLPHEAWHVVQQKQGRVQANTVAPIQMVRALITRPIDAGGGITLAILEGILGEVDREIAELASAIEEVSNGFISEENMGNLPRWRAQFGERLAGLRDLAPGERAFSIEEIKARADALTEAVYGVVVCWGNIARTLNTSLREFTAWKEARELAASSAYVADEAYAEKGTREKQKPKPRPTPSGKGPVGLDGKWGRHREALAFDGQTKFVQFVPADADSIARCMASQRLSDAVYNTNKAFWISNEKKYTIASSGGKRKMIYTFTPEGARSLVEDYLICGSGDYAEDNEEEWMGETAHPDYTIWKTNEIGAYGVGFNRLRVLEGQCERIEVE